MDSAAIIKRLIGLGVLALAALLGLAGLFGSWFTVDQGERAIVLRQGQFLRVAEPGLNFKLPIFDNVVEMSVRTEKVVYPKLTSYSKDIQLAELRVAVNIRADFSRVKDIYERYGDFKAAIDRVLTPRVADEVKVVFGRFNAQTSISERGRLGLEIEEALRKSVEGTGLLLESSQLEEIDFSKAFEASIEERMKAEVEVSRLKQNLEREKVQADIVRTAANGQADATRARAQAEADAIRLRGNAEAEAIKARANALNQNASLIELVKAEKWNGALPTTMLPNQSTPLIQIK